LGALQGAPNISTDLVGGPDLLDFFMEPRFEDGSVEPKAYVANLIIDNEGSDGRPKFPNAIPFIGIGAHKGWGNRRRVGRMNVTGAPRASAWISTLKSAFAGRPEDAYSHTVVAVAKWRGKQRMIQLLLYHHNLEASDAYRPGIHRHWNWPARNSFWYPGADIAFIDAEDIEIHCGPGAGTVPRMTEPGESYIYYLDWEFLFRCLSDQQLFDDPMPKHRAVSILGVHWVVELFGNASIWVTVSDMEMVL
jgi:hypothetical protein